MDRGEPPVVGAGARTAVYPTGAKLMPQVEIEGLLKDAMGLDAASIGSSAITRAVQERQAGCQLNEPVAYLERVRTSETELQELIDAVVVSETWFFRGREAFTGLARLTLGEWLPRQ